VRATPRSSALIGRAERTTVEYNANHRGLELVLYSTGDERLFVVAFGASLRVASPHRVVP
jgi:hypothetical protein